MDNPNPIYYRDLITPDDSITNLIAQLGQLIDEYDKAQTKIQGAARVAAQSMQNLSGATEEQRKAIQLTTEESDKLVAQYRDITSAQWQAKQAFAEATAAKKESAQIDKLITQINTSAEGSYNRLSAQYRLNKIRLNEMSESERNATEAGRKLEAETKAIHDRMNDLQKSTGKYTLQVGNYERALGGALGVNSKFLSVLTDTSKASETLKGVLAALATPVGIAIAAIGAATAAFKLFKSSIHETQQSGDAFDLRVAGWRATWDRFKQSVSTFDWSGFIRGAKEAARSGRELQTVLDEMFERSVSTRLQRAGLTQELATLEENIKNTGLSVEERRKAADDYINAVTPIYQQEIDQAKDVRDKRLSYLFDTTNRRKFASEEEKKAAQEEFAANLKNYELNKELIKQAFEYVDAEDKLRESMRLGGIDPMRVEYQKTVNAAGEDVKAFADFARQYRLTNDEKIEAYVKAEEDYQKAQSALYNENKRLISLKHNLEKQETDDVKKNYADRQKAADDYAKEQERLANERAKLEEKQRKEAEDARQKEIADKRAMLQFDIQNVQLQIAITQDGTQEMLQLRLDAIKKQMELELFENSQKDEKLRLDEQKIRAKYDALLLKETSDFNTKLAQRDLKAYQDLQEAEFNLQNKNERQKTIFRLQQEKARLEAILKINETASEKLTQTEIDAIKKTIEQIDKETQKVGYNNIYEVLGINLDSDQQSALNTALDAVKDSIGSLIDSWNAVAEAAVNAANEQVDAAQRALDAEIEARNAGYANEVVTTQKELELAKKNQEKALKEQQRAQKARQALEAIQQASNLVTASALIWSQLGFPYAIPAIAIMWTSFAAAKIKAAQVSKPAETTETYGDGTVELLQGGSHASGHDIDLGTKPNGTRRRAEGGEFFAVINKRNSRRFRDVIPDVINSFNDGTFADRYQRANATMAGYAVQMVGNGTDVSGLQKDVSAIREQGETTQYVDGQGNTIIRYKNLTRKIKS